MMTMKQYSVEGHIYILDSLFLNVFMHECWMGFPLFVVPFSFVRAHKHPSPNWNIRVKTKSLDKIIN